MVPLGPESSRHTTLSLLTKAKLHIKVGALTCCSAPSGVVRVSLLLRGTKEAVSPGWSLSSSHLPPQHLNPLKSEIQAPAPQATGVPTITRASASHSLTCGHLHLPLWTEGDTQSTVSFMPCPPSTHTCCILRVKPLLLNCECHSECFRTQDMRSSGLSRLCSNMAEPSAFLVLSLFWPRAVVPAIPSAVLVPTSLCLASPDAAELCTGLPFPVMGSLTY